MRDIPDVSYFSFGYILGAIVVFSLLVVPFFFMLTR